MALLVPNPAQLAPCLRSVGGGPPTSVPFINRLNSEVKVNWIDYNGTLKLYKVLAPNSQYNQQTYVNHPWLIYTDTAFSIFHPLPGENQHRAIIDNFTRPGGNTKTDLIPIREMAALPSLRSLSGGAPTRVTFFNDRFEAVRLYWIDFEGKRVLYATLQPGGSDQQPTFVNHPWVVTTVTNPEYPLYIFQPTAAPDTTATIF